MKGYTKEFNRGDIVYWRGGNPTYGIIKSKSKTDAHGPCWILDVPDTNLIYNSCHESNLRLASKEEIKLLLKAKPKFFAPELIKNPRIKLF